MIEEHARRTGSPQAKRRFSATGTSVLPHFVKVYPHELKRVLGVERSATQYSGCARDEGGRGRGGAAWVSQLGFLEFERTLPTRRAPEERVKDWFEIYQEFPRTSRAAAGRALHGVRRAVLPYGMPGQQPHSGLE